eukprot:g10357.t1
MWKKMQEYDRANFLMGASIHTDRHEREHRREDGLVEAHAYSVIHAAELNGVQNPWGNKMEWNGPWCDQSDEWSAHPEIAEALGVDEKADGLFWMDWESFEQTFTMEVSPLTMAFAHLALTGALKTPLLGICLGHQALGLAEGWRLSPSPFGPKHGVTEEPGESSPARMMRYNSLILHPPETGSALQVCAWDATGKLPMALEHKDFQVFGVQFHPESAGSYQGEELLSAFLQTSAAAKAQAMLAPVRLQHLTVQAAFSHWQARSTQLQEARRLSQLLLERFDLAVLRACYGGWRDVYGRSPAHVQRLRHHQWTLRRRDCFRRVLSRQEVDPNYQAQHLSFLLWWRSARLLRGRRLGTPQQLAYLQELISHAVTVWWAGVTQQRTEVARNTAERRRMALLKGCDALTRDEPSLRAAALALRAPLGPQYVPQLLEGYWSDSQDPVSIYKCEPRASCPGGKPGDCAGGLSGIPCARCPGGQTWAGKECAECSGVTFVLWAIVPPLCLVCLLKSYDLVDSKADGEASPLQACLIAAGIAFNVMQTIAVFGLMSVTWSQSLSSASSGFQIFLLDLDQLGLNCVLGSNNVTRFLLRVAIFPVASLTLLSRWALAVRTLPCPRFLPQRCRVQVKKWVLFKTMNCIGKFLQVGFATFSAVSLQPLMCYHHPNGLHSILKYPSTFCGDSEHVIMIVIGMVLMAIFVVGFFAACSLAAWKMPTWSLKEDHRWVQSFTFLTGKFRLDTWWFGMLLLLRGFALSITVVLGTDRPQVQIALASLVMLLYLCALVRVWPWKARVLNVADTALSAGMLLLVRQASAATLTGDQFNDVFSALILSGEAPSTDGCPQEQHVPVQAPPVLSVLPEQTQPHCVPEFSNHEEKLVSSDSHKAQEPSLLELVHAKQCFSDGIPAFEQVAWGSWTILLYQSILLKVWPWKASVLNFADTACSVCLLLLINHSVLFVTSPETKRVSEEFSEEFSAVMLARIVNARVHRARSEPVQLGALGAWRSVFTQLWHRTRDRHGFPSLEGSKELLEIEALQLEESLMELNTCDLGALIRTITLISMEVLPCFERNFNSRHGAVGEHEAAVLQVRYG